MLRIRALPRSHDAQYKRVVGENIFCDEWDCRAEERGEWTCSGRPEVEVECWSGRTRKWCLLVCREHAGFLATQITETIDLADGGDILRWVSPGR